MARPSPAPEDVKIRTTISLPRKVHELAERYREMHPEENLADFSATVAAALISHAARQHPQLLAKIIDSIRSDGEPELMVAEAPASYGVKIKKNDKRDEGKKRA